ncbi:MAG: hypothetical protein HKN26_15110 [Acidimicrobiales bacterium]|nr:hypothetical protein [Acidimicrobiales bacterium]
MMTEIFDRPTHVLLLHYPVVMIPLSCLAAILLALRPAWRRQYGWALVGLTFTVLVSTILTVASGEAFAEAAKLEKAVERHAELGEATRIFVVGLFLAVLGLVGFGRYADRQGDEMATNAKAVTAGLVAATLAFSVLSTVWVIRTGHEGVRVTYLLVDLSG